MRTSFGIYVHGRHLQRVPSLFFSDPLGWNPPCSERSVIRVIRYSCAIRPKTSSHKSNPSTAKAIELPGFPFYLSPASGSPFRVLTVVCLSLSHLSLEDIWLQSYYARHVCCILCVHVHRICKEPGRKHTIGACLPPFWNINPEAQIMHSVRSLFLPPGDLVFAWHL